MTELKHTMIYRGGVTSTTLVLETDECSYYADEENGNLEISFSMASKGGGSTSVEVRIGREDLPEILKSIATDLSGAGVMLLSAAITAHEARVEKLKQAEYENMKIKESIVKQREVLMEVNNFLWGKIVDDQHEPETPEYERLEQLQEKYSEAIDELEGLEYEYVN